MSAQRKSKGGGTILLLAFLFLAIAGGSAWVIHMVLSGKEVPFAATGASSPQADPASGQDGAATGTPGGPARDAPAVSGGEGGSAPQDAGQGPAVLPGGVVVESIPGGTAEGAPGVSEALPHPSVTAGDGAERENGPERENASSPSLLVVPGTSAFRSSLPDGDSVVRPAFVADIAGFLAQNYWPKGTHPSAKKHGITTASLRWANLRYGAELRSLDGRQAVLDYVLTPSTVSRLYSLYAAPFIASLSHEAETRAAGEAGSERLLTVAEKKEMFGIYSAYAARIAAALERYAAAPGMAAKVEAYAAASDSVEEANKAYLESVLAYENGMAGSDASLATAARLKRDKEAATYQKRIREREAAHRALVAAMAGGGAKDDGNDLVYVAFWAYRRGADSAPALKACAKALSDISGKLAAEAKSLR